MQSLDRPQPFAGDDLFQFPRELAANVFVEVEAHWKRRDLARQIARPAVVGDDKTATGGKHPPTSREAPPA